MSIYGQPSSETTSETEVHASFPHTLQKTVPLCARYPLPTKEKKKHTDIQRAGSALTYPMNTVLTAKVKACVIPPAPQEGRHGFNFAFARPSQDA